MYRRCTEMREPTSQPYGGTRVLSERVHEEMRAALAAAADASATPAERAEMLMEIAMGLQLRPKSPDQLHSAVELYETALTLCPEEQRLLRARITARMGTALQAIPASGTALLERARAAFEQAIATLKELRSPGRTRRSRNESRPGHSKSQPPPGARASPTRFRPISGRCAHSIARASRPNSRSCKTILRPRSCRCRSPTSAPRCARRWRCRRSRRV